jgi:hypothetical protein
VECAGQSADAMRRAVRPVVGPRIDAATGQQGTAARLRLKAKGRFGAGDAGLRPPPSGHPARASVALPRGPSLQSVTMIRRAPRATSAHRVAEIDYADLRRTACADQCLSITMLVRGWTRGRAGQSEPRSAGTGHESAPEFAAVTLSDAGPLRLSGGDPQGRTTPSHAPSVHAAPDRPRSNPQTDRRTDGTHPPGAVAAAPGAALTPCAAVRGPRLPPRGPLTRSLLPRSLLLGGPAPGAG